MMQEEHPGIFEELNRKTVESLLWVAQGVDDGTLSNQQAYAAVQAIFKSVAGLVSRDVGDLISQASSEYSYEDIAVFILPSKTHPDRDVLKIIHAKDRAVGVRKYSAADLGVSKTARFADKYEAQRAFAKHLRVSTDNGYRRLEAT